ncbi:MAG: 4-hydroxy-3-methylbut-2-enyl diphosphate reductase [Chitinivibrionales bacterium]|nr:4-hydroxy-3-methylbut-2-enyl diphosphate reductase [Chitinivibrionales bacterium]
MAKTAGFCMGVRRAVDLALEHTSSADAELYTLGKLIHNRSAVELLQQRGAQVLDESSPPPPGTRVLVRAHGVPPQTQQQYSSRGHVIVDGTCPKVKTVHKVITRYRERGYSIVISGDEGHAEVVGLLGYAGDAGHLIQSPDDVERLPMFDKVCLVSQTTFDKELFEAIAERVEKRYGGGEVAVKKTICSATEMRQEETRRVAADVDAMIVVGGMDSANTLRLASIAAKTGTPTQHVETEQDINWESIADCEAVGVTAGASTPHWMIRRVVEYLQLQARAEEHSMRGIARGLFDLGIHLNGILALGAAALYYASCVLQGYAFRITGSVLAFLYFMSMYLWNSLANLEMTRHLGIQRYRFYSTHRPLLFGLAGACVAALLVLSYSLNPPLFYLIIFATVAGTAYHVTIVPRFLRPLVRYSNLRDIPTSRDLFVALAWGVLITFIPQALEQRLSLSAETVLTFIWVFSLAYLRSLIFDLRDIEGDRIMGRETLVTIVGEKRARKAILAGIRLLLVIMAAYALIDIVGRRNLTTQNAAFVLQIPVLAAVRYFARYKRSYNINRTTVLAAVIDAQFILAGLLAGLATAIVSVVKQLPPLTFR